MTSPSCARNQHSGPSSDGSSEDRRVNEARGGRAKCPQNPEITGEFVWNNVSFRRLLTNPCCSKCFCGSIHVFSQISPSGRFSGQKPCPIEPWSSIICSHLAQMAQNGQTPGIHFQVHGCHCVVRPQNCPRSEKMFCGICLIYTAEMLSTNIYTFVKEIYWHPTIFQNAIATFTAR